ncbi:MAG: bacillithiol biosynthesis cysteine-adding enzyme BshC [Bryobacteraceae bacterium]|nr:bacillithiol biosynthesis cysteine-adding enzyme BshC [Bryobacteraceae bacterium]
MRFSSVPLGSLPGASALFAAYVSSSPAAMRFYRHDPFSAEGRRAAAAEAQEGGAPRAEVVEALRRFNSGNPAVEVLLQPGAVAVVTGQQAGLFGGPAFTLYKALTAVRVARHLGQMGIPAVPVFWIATEDHDLAEVSVTHVFDTRIRPVRLQASADAFTGRPIGTIPLAHPPLEELAGALRGFLHAGEVLGLAEAAYRPGRTFGEAFHALMESLLGPHGIVFLDPLQPEMRRLAAPLLARAWERRAELGDALAVRRRELEQAGFHAQVEVADGAGLFFVLEDGMRRRASLFSGDPDPERLSPNALLRPVMQDWLLPTAIYVGGPAEIAYFAQAEVLYSRLLGRMPAILPRAGFTLVDGRTRRLMERHGITLAHCMRGEEALVETLAARLAPQSLEAAFEETGAGFTRLLDRLREELDAFDPSLASALDLSRAKILYQLARIRRKAERAALRRQSDAEQQARHAFRLLTPERRLQERYYSFLPFLARYGLRLVDDILAAADPIRPAHEILAP